MRRSIISQTFHDNGKQVTKELLDTLFEYRSGILYRKHHGQLTPITCKGKVGYIVANIFGTIHYVHRLIWCMHTGVYPEMPVDHIDHDKTNTAYQDQPVWQATFPLQTLNDSPQPHCSFT